MTRIMATGVFDILHPGHIHFLSESKKLGDELVVVVARDSTAGKRGKSPIFDERSRLTMISQLKLVDRAILGHEDDIYKTVEEVRPDIITLGFDQHFNEEEVKEKCRSRGIDVEIVRITKASGTSYTGSSQIKEKLLQNIEDRL